MTALGLETDHALTMDISKLIKTISEIRFQPSIEEQPNQTIIEHKKEHRRATSIQVRYLRKGLEDSPPAIIR
tara:strand:- start:109 stop:324 length:216 start_codon:yes stop_codon:yes gene_type:complete